MNGSQTRLVALAVLAALTLVAATVAVALASPVLAQSGMEAAAPVDPSVARWGFVAGAAAASLSALGAAYAVAQVGTAAMGLLAEKPEMMGRALILVGLAEGIAIYGLIVAILIFNRIG